VAIIDLRVFVPEVISVLATFAQSSFNDILSQIPFVNALIGKKSYHSKPMWLLNGTNSNHVILQEAIRNSDIEVLSLVSQEIKDSIILRIFKLKQFQSLYGTQLEAFAMGLNKALHCTQGPPGNVLKC